MTTRLFPENMAFGKTTLDEGGTTQQVIDPDGTKEGEAGAHAHACSVLLSSSVPCCRDHVTMGSEQDPSAFEQGLVLHSLRGFQAPSSGWVCIISLFLTAGCLLLGGADAVPWLPALQTGLWGSSASSCGSPSRESQREHPLAGLRASTSPRSTSQENTSIPPAS